MSCKVIKQKNRQEQKYRVVPTNKPLGRGSMPLRDLVVNGKAMPILRYINNSLTKEAQTKFDLGTVDMDIVHTTLTTIGLEIVSSNTHGLIYYLPHKLELAIPISASVGVLLANTGQKGTDIETFTYDGAEYKFQQYKFSLRGVMGCTATVNLGFCLLKEFQALTIRQLGVLIVLDRDRLKDIIRLDLPVADGSIMQFCKDRASQLITIANAESDCDEFPECKNQPGQRCDWYEAKCRARA